MGQANIARLTEAAESIIVCASTGSLGFYGTTAVTQRGDASQVAFTDSSAGTVSDTLGAYTGVDGTGSNAFALTDGRNLAASVADKINEIRTVLVNLGLMKGSA